MLTDLRSILALAEEKGCAIPAFNCYTQECVMGVLEAAKETGAPVIFQMFSRLADTNDGNFVAPAILEAIRQLPQPAVMHLDHGAGIPEVVRAIRLGMTGVMIDASTLPLEENIATTKLAAELCGYVGVPVEGELGHVGAAKDEVLGNYTDVAEAERFVKETGVSALAVMVGTAHGRYKKAPVLDIQRIRDIREATGKLPLVLHGGSGIENDYILRGIKAGIAKINVGTELRQPYERAMREKNDVEYARECVYTRCRELIRDFLHTAGDAEILAK